MNTTSACGLPYHVSGEIVEERQLLVQTRQSLHAAFDLDVRTGHEVTAVDTDNRTVTVRTATGESKLSTGRVGGR